MSRGFRAAILLVAAAATAGCSILIGVSGDPVVVDDEGGNARADGAAESGAEAAAANFLDAAAVGETGPGD